MPCATFDCSAHPKPSNQRHTFLQHMKSLLHAPISNTQGNTCISLVFAARLLTNVHCNLRAQRRARSTLFQLTSTQRPASYCVANTKIVFNTQLFRTQSKNEQCYNEQQLHHAAQCYNEQHYTMQNISHLLPHAKSTKRALHCVPDSTHSHINNKHVSY